MPISLGPNVIIYVGVGIVFLVIIGIFAMIGRSFSSAPEVGDRLTQFAGRQQERAHNEAQAKALAKFDAAVAKGKRGGEIARNLARADLKLTVTEFIGIKILAAIAGAGIGALVGRASPQAQLLSALVGAVVISFVPDIYVGQAAKRRVKAFNDQLGDAINLLANSLRSGYSFLQSMEL